MTNLEDFKIVRAAVDALPPEKHPEFLAAVFRIQMALERAEENVPRVPVVEEREQK